MFIQNAKSQSIAKTTGSRLSVLACCLMAGQSVSPFLYAEGKPAAIEEIVVTARKREENLQDTPISITAFTSQSLEALQVDNISQISSATPGLTFDSSTPISGSRVSSSIFIRGIGQTDFTLVSDPGVGLYLDGVYIARSVGGVLDVVDVERVEVLRGPQGTLFGKNTIGGAINITSKRAGDEFAGEVEIKTGTDDRLDFKATVDIPFTENFRGKFSYANLNQDGNVKNLVGGKDLNDTDAQVLHARLDFEPTDSLSMMLTADWTDRDEQAQAQRLLSFEPTAGLVGVALNDAVAAVVPGFDIGDYTCLGTSATAQAMTADDCHNPFVTSSGSNTPSEVEVKGAAFTLTYDFGSVTFKSVTGYREFDALFARDTDNSPYILVETIDTMDQEQFSQEFQLSGTGLNDRLNWLLGYYHFEEEGNNRNDVITSTFYLKSGGDIDNDSDAFFGQVTFDITERWSVTAGLRKTDETKGFTPDQFVTVDPSGNLATTFLDNTLQFAKVVRGQLPTVAEFDLVPHQKFERDFDETTGLLSLDFKATEDLLLFASYATGFKSGGFNQRIPPPGVPEPINYEPETSTTYELGWKWTNQGKTLRINGSYYFTDYEDLQVNVFAGVAPTTLNAVEAEIQGYEVELLASPIEALSITANIAYIDAEYTKAPGTIPGARTINKNDKFPNTPEFTAFVGIDYTWLLGTGELTLHADWSYRDEVQNNTINSPQIEQDALDLFNAALIYRLSEHWQLAFSGRNLTDETYLITGNEELPGFGYAEGVYAREREWALSAKYSF
ncbi:MAG: TonB-dependent receptor [Pseudomonadales bacterium]|nr:TonB-dependent receptor [Pseudomonadales bacterium]